MSSPTDKRGFTIIEVVLVLAIAGLIFLMVFIALPALQRTQRDSQRREDVGRFISQINQYQTNERGRVPSISNMTGSEGFLEQYMSVSDGEFQDPRTGNNYTVNADAPQESRLQYRTGHSCDGSELVSGAGARSVAVRVDLEGSGIYCQDNQ